MHRILIHGPARFRRCRSVAGGGGRVGEGQGWRERACQGTASRRQRGDARSQWGCRRQPRWTQLTLPLALPREPTTHLLTRLRRRRRRAPNRGGGTGCGPGREGWGSQKAGQVRPRHALAHFRASALSLLSSRGHFTVLMVSIKTGNKNWNTRTHLTAQFSVTVAACVLTPRREDRQQALQP